jgi:hypothetical protein
MHAGFDLEAVLGEAKPEEMKVQKNRQPTSSLVPRTSPRPGSAPPRQRASDAPASSSSQLYNGKAGPGKTETPNGRQIPEI